MTEINILSDLLINKIAAGEVVERPASVVKELIENSVDANSKRINIEVKGGGREIIVVEDDGIGILKDDIPLALMRHTTSKIKDERDLEAISTLGFRGEAISAIASISKIRIESRRRGEDKGYAIECEGGKAGEIFPVGMKEGTRVIVKDLFYNTPVRAKFLKSTQTELSHIISLVESYSLSRIDTYFSLSSNGAHILEVSPSKSYKERFFDIFEEFDKKDFRDVYFEKGDLIVSGIVREPDKNLSTSRYIFTTVNGRFVKDRLLNSAILRSFEEKIPKGRYPVVFINLSLPFKEVDVNIHPMKKEVKFRNPNFVYDSTVKAISNSFLEKESVFIEERSESKTFKFNQPPLIKESEPLFEIKSKELNEFPAQKELVRPSRYRVIGIFKRGFILLESDEGLSIVDQHTLHERIRFEQFKRFIEKNGERMQFLETRNFFVPRNLLPRIEELCEILTTQGFDSEILSDGAIGVRSAPPFLDEREIDKLIEEFIANGDEVLRTPKEKLKEVLMMRSCRGAVMLGEEISVEKAQYLIDLLFSMNAPLTCPHGRPVIFTIKLKEIMAKFGRK